LENTNDKKVNILWDLFISFLKIGLFTFGGGYAMISLIEDTCVSKKEWITHDEMMNMTVLAESTPGPIAINCATYVGYKKKGLLGAIVATFGMVVPSLVIILIISKLLDNFLEITWIANAFKGIKLAVGLLILDASFKMLKKMKKKPLTIIFLCFGTLSMLAINIFSLNFSTIGLLLIAGFASLLIFVIRKGAKKE